MAIVEPADLGQRRLIDGQAQFTFRGSLRYEFAGPASPTTSGGTVPFKAATFALAF